MTQLVLSLVAMFAAVAGAAQWALTKQRRMHDTAQQSGPHDHPEVRHDRDRR